MTLYEKCQRLYEEVGCSIPIYRIFWGFRLWPRCYLWIDKDDGFFHVDRASNKHSHDSLFGRCVGIDIDENGNRYTRDGLSGAWKVVSSWPEQNKHQIRRIWALVSDEISEAYRQQFHQR